MSVLAFVRPDSWNFPLFLHVLGAMILVGGLLAGASALAFAKGEARLLRLGYWSLLAVSLPGWVLMRIGAGWIYSKEHWGDVPKEPDWLGIGYITADLGALLLITSVVLAGFGARRLAQADSGPSIMARSAGVLTIVVLAAYLVAVWAMTAKPT